MKIEDKNGTLIWNCIDMNSKGNITAIERSPQRKRTEYVYTNKGFLFSEKTSGILEMEYGFTENTSNLIYRKNKTKNTEDQFMYDGLDRLAATYKMVNGQNNLASSQTINYSNNGNIMFKSDVGDYGYDFAKLHAVRFTENAPADMVSTQTPTNPLQTIEYTYFNSIKKITENGFTLDFDYNLEDQRIKSTLKNNGNLLKEKYFSDSYEKEITYASGKESGRRQLTYIEAPSGLVAIYVQVGASNVGQYYYTYTDYLGSILSITDASGIVVEQRNYDAWGRLRDPNTLNYVNNSGNYKITDRGYTGHEHMLEFNLVNMNGRLYDPVLARMLSPDNYVQDATYSQNFNRYAYVWNNPLKYTDPNGEFVFVPILIGAMIGAYSGYKIGQAHGATGWGMAGYIAGGALLGGASGGAALGVSAAGGGAMLAGMAGGAVAGAGFNGLATGWNGQAMFDGAWKGGLAGLVGGGVGAAIGGGWGALAGGATGSGLNTGLNGGDLNDIAISAAIGGGMAFGLYHGSTYYNWKFGGGNQFGDIDVSYRQYAAMQADFQRSRFWGKEYGGALMNDGSVQRFGSETRANNQINGAKLPPGAKAWYHTHWDAPGNQITVDAKGNYIGEHYTGTAYERTTTQYHSPADLTNTSRSIVINRFDASYYPGTGGANTVQPINVPINRFFYTFLFWR